MWSVWPCFTVGNGRPALPSVQCEDRLRVWRAWFSAGGRRLDWQPMSTSEEGPEVNPPADGVLDRIRGPRDLRRLTRPELDVLAGEIRDFLVEKVARTGGHLGPNLGVVELTIALHRVFDSPRDRVLFDTGHQSYVHKLLTGRQDFGGLRAKGGVSGYPSRAESEHDVIENSHASTVLGWADGLAKANEVRGRGDRHVVA